LTWVRLLDVVHASSSNFFFTTEPSVIKTKQGLFTGRCLSSGQTDWANTLKHNESRALGITDDDSNSSDTELVQMMCISSKDSQSDNTTYDPVDWFSVEAAVVWLRLHKHQVGCCARLSHGRNRHHCLLRWQQRVVAGLPRGDPVSSSRLCCSELERRRYISTPYIHVATSEMWCWSRGRGIL